MEENETASVVRDLTAVATETKPIDITKAVKLVRDIGGAMTMTYKVWDIEKYLPAPMRIREKLEFQDHNGFADYFKSFANEDSRIFFDATCATFTGILDFSGSDTPEWGDHVITLPLRKSEEWKIWSTQNGKPMGQVAFGRFIEENMIDIVSPDGATLLEMVMTFEATKSLSFREAHRLKDGRTQFSWVEEMKTGDIEIPDSITIKIPVFAGQEPREIKLRFRYNINDQKLSLYFEIVRQERVLNDASAEIVKFVAAALDMTVLTGKRLTSRP